MNKKETVVLIKDKVSAWNPRSAWDKGVKETVADFITSLEEWLPDLEDSSLSPGRLEKTLLNGAQDWHAFAEGGCSLCYTSDIVERFCTPSEKAKFAKGRLYGLDPMNVMYRGCYQAYVVIARIVRGTYEV